MKAILLFLCCLCFVFAHSQEISINDHWQFNRSDVQNAQRANFDTGNWEVVNLPHTWNAKDAFDDVPGFYQGPAWYRKSIFINKSKSNKKVFIHFEGANQVAEVYVNGNKVGVHKGGYTAFTFAITSELNFGQNNIIAVRVNNAINQDIPPLSADFTFYGGIYRDVSLIFKNPVHFDLSNGAKGVSVATPKVNIDKAEVQLKTSIVNEAEVGSKLNLTTSIMDKDWKELVKNSKKISLGKKDTLRTEVGLSVETPHLWSPKKPYLYSVVIKITDRKGNVVDEQVVPLGLRWFSLDEKGRFVLNGKPLKLIGANRHQDFKGLGNALPDPIHENDIKLVKEMGGNFMRLAHYPQNQRLLEACDSYGVLVWQEIPIVNTITESEGFTTNSINMLKEMVTQYRNHPSIVMWGFMNEVILRPPDKVKKDEKVRKTYWENIRILATKLDSVLDSEDPSRLTTIANHDKYPVYEKIGLNDITDVLGYNIYYGWYGARFEDLQGFTKKIKKDHPEQGYIIAEYGAGADPRIHSYTPEKFDFSIEWQKIFHKYYLKHILDSDKITGATLWNLADFGSEHRRDALPHINSKGILNYDRKPKDVYYLYQSALSDKPVVHIASSDWKYRIGEGKDTCSQAISVFTNAAEVELFINGKSLGKKKPDFHEAIFDVLFPDGESELRAEANFKERKVFDFQKIDFNLIPKNLKNASLSTNFDLHINLGTPDYFIDPIERIAWMPEKKYEPGSHGYIGGKRYERQSWNSKKLGSDAPIKGTRNAPLYQTMREGITSYKFDVPNGEYELTLYFSELVGKTPTPEMVYNLGKEVKAHLPTNDRIFDVFINGKNMLSNFSPGRDFGEYMAISKKIKVLVNDEQGITINFEEKSGESILNAIELRKVD